MWLGVDVDEKHGERREKWQEDEEDSDDQYCKYVSSEENYPDSDSFEEIRDKNSCFIDELPVELKLRWDVWNSQVQLNLSEVISKGTFQKRQNLWTKHIWKHQRNSQRF